MTKTEKKQLQNKANYLRKKQQRILETKLSAIKFMIWPKMIFSKRFKFKIKEFFSKFDSFEKVLLVFLIALLTFFSVRESYLFLVEIEGRDGAPLLKALTCEAAVLGLSYLSFEKLTLKVLKSFLLISRCVYSFFSTSGKILFEGSQEFERASILREQILDIESEIKMKSSLRSSYQETERFSAMRKIDQTIDSLQEKLRELKQARTELKSPLMIQVSIFSQSFFRICILLVNILCTHTLAESLRRKGSAKFSQIQPKLRLIQTV